MTTAYPTGTDAFTRPSSSQFQNSPALDVVTDDIMDTLEALEKRPLRVYDVKGAGAVGDGVADDDDEILSVLGADRKIYFPPGIYVVDDAVLTLHNNSVWEGAGMGLSTIFLKTQANGKLIDHSGAISNVTFKDLTFDGNMLNQTNGGSRDDRSGLFVRQITGLQIIRCEIKNFRSGAAVRTYGCSDILYFGNRFHSNGIRAVTVNNETITTSNTDVEVDSTASWPSSGKFKAADVVVTYQSLGTSPTRFVNCTVASGSKVLNAGSWIFPIGTADSDVLICDATFTDAAQDYRAVGNRYYSNTDTGTAMDGVVGFTVMNNVYRANLLGCGIAWVGNETGGSADSCEDGTIKGNTIIGPNLTTVESQGIKSAKYNALGGDGGNNRNIVIEGNVIRLCDRSLWLDTLDDSTIAMNILKNAVGPNEQHILLATGTETVNGLSIHNNRLKDANVGLRIDTAGGVTDLMFEDNEFGTDVTTKVSGTIPTMAKFKNNERYNGTFAVDDITVTASPMLYTAGHVPEVVFIHTNASGTTTIRKESGGVILHETVTVAQRLTFPLEPNETLHITYGSAPSRFSRYRK